MNILKKFDQLFIEVNESLEMAFSESALQYEFVLILLYSISPIISLVTLQKHHIEKFLTEDPEGSKCWIEYKEKFENIFNSLAEEILNKTQTLTDFDETLKPKTAEFQFLVDKYHAAVIIECIGKFPKCYEDYVSFILIASTESQPNFYSNSWPLSLSKSKIL